MSRPERTSHGWSDFTEQLRQQRLMDEMMLVQKADMVAAVSEGEAFVRARANCRNCMCADACRDWFLEGSKTQADFCPNLGFFETVKGGNGQD
jgi:hypothetical protein